MTIEHSWTIIEQRLASEFPAAAATLNAGASMEKIKTLEHVIGQPLPKDFVASLMRHDGQRQSDLEGSELLNFNRLLTVDEMIHDWKQCAELFEGFGEIEWLQPKRIKNLTWNTGWLRFSDFQNDGFVLDLDPTEQGIVGQIFFRPNSENQTQTWADSFSGFLARLAALYESKTYELEQGCPYVHIPIG
ncbi:MAG: SMI1/KNR4 family protein [Pseudomonas sp.]|uniref:SMI1/KNR4 family protein n=1 Tax=Pseudomonas sp. TaxID=306 RepID=UPI003390BA61